MIDISPNHHLRSGNLTGMFAALCAYVHNAPKTSITDKAASLKLGSADFMQSGFSIPEALAFDYCWKALSGVVY